MMEELSFLVNFGQGLSASGGMNPVPATEPKTPVFWMDTI